MDRGYKELRTRDVEGIENDGTKRSRKAKDDVRRQTTELEESDKVFNDGLKKAESKIKKRTRELEEEGANLEAFKEFLDELIKVM